MSKYHDKYKCEQCEGVNEITVTSSPDGIIEECKTKCTKCDHEDYWAYGYYDRGYYNNLTLRNSSATLPPHQNAAAILAPAQMAVSALV